MSSHILNKINTLIKNFKKKNHPKNKQKRETKMCNINSRGESKKGLSAYLYTLKTFFALTPRTVLEVSQFTADMLKYCTVNSFEHGLLCKDRAC